MITILIKTIFICVLIVLGITIVTQRNMLLYSIRLWAEKKTPKIYEVLILCHWCMPTFYSLVSISLCYLLNIITFFDYRIAIIYFLTICGSSILCGIIWGIYLLIEEITIFFSDKNLQNGNQEISEVE